MASFLPLRGTDGNVDTSEIARSVFHLDIPQSKIDVAVAMANSPQSLTPVCLWVVANAHFMEECAALSNWVIKCCVYVFM